MSGWLPFTECPVQKKKECTCIRSVDEADISRMIIKWWTLYSVVH